MAQDRHPLARWNVHIAWPESSVHNRPSMCTTLQVTGTRMEFVFNGRLLVDVQNPFE